MEDGEDASGLMNKFLAAVVVLRMALAIIKNRPDQSISIDLWEAYSERMEDVVESVVEVLRDDEQCEVWGKEFKGEIHRP